MNRVSRRVRARAEWLVLQQVYFTMILTMLLDSVVCWPLTPRLAIREAEMLEKIVRLAVEATVNDEQLEPFKSIAKQMTEASQAEPGTLGYEWFFSSDDRHCRLLETYADASAVLAHFKGPVVTNLVPQLMPLCRMDRFEIYGDPGPEVSQMAAGFGAQFYSYAIGINR
jgi:quinol monooxygenase YgiN